MKLLIGKKEEKTLTNQKPSPEAKAPRPEKERANKFEANSRYFTIAIYVIIVASIAAIIFKAIISFDETMAAFKHVINVLMPFITGALIAFILNPAVQKFCFLLEKYTRLKRPGVIKGLAILITYLLLFSLVILALVGIIPQILQSVTDLINSSITTIPQTVDDLTAFLNSLQERFPSLDMSFIQDSINNTIPSILNYIKDLTTNLVPSIYSASVSVMQWLLDLIIALIVSVYMLTDKKLLLNSFKVMIYAFVPEKRIDSVLETLANCNKVFSGFVIGKAIDSLIIGILCFILMTILRLPYTMLISLIVGVTNMIPYFGPFIGAIPGVVITLMINPLQALIFGIMVFALQQFDGLILGPKILGESVGLRPLWIIIAITVGGSIAGVLGMFLGVPIVAVFRYLILKLLDYRLSKRNLSGVKDLPVE